MSRFQILGRRPLPFSPPGLGAYTNFYDTIAFLLAAIQLDGMFSIVTTEPNESVAPVHDRMPLVLGPGESKVWLGPDFAGLANREAIVLTSNLER